MTVCGASVCKLFRVNLVPRLFFVTSPCSLSLALSLLYVSWPSRCLTLKHKDAPACVEMLHMRAVKVLQALCASGSICQRAQTSPLLAAAASLWMSVAAPRSDVLRNTENNPTWQKNKTEMTECRSGEAATSNTALTHKYALWKLQAVVAASSAGLWVYKGPIFWSWTIYLNIDPFCSLRVSVFPKSETTTTEVAKKVIVVSDLSEEI